MIEEEMKKNSSKINTKISESTSLVEPLFSKITDLWPTTSSKNGTNSTLDVSMKV